MKMGDFLTISENNDGQLWMIWNVPDNYLRQNKTKCLILKQNWEIVLPLILYFLPEDDSIWLSTQISMKAKHLRRHLRKVFDLSRNVKKRDLDKLLNAAIQSTGKMVKSNKLITLLKHKIK